MAGLAGWLAWWGRTSRFIPVKCGVSSMWVGVENEMKQDSDN